MGKDDNGARKIPEQKPESHPYVGIAAKKNYVQAEGGSSRYKPQDPSICMRVIKDGPGGQEFIISGNPEDTFAHACKSNWYFESVNRKSNWSIRDEHGNDVTDNALVSREGSFTLIPE